MGEQGRDWGSKGKSELVQLFLKSNHRTFSLYFSLNQKKSTKPLPTTLFLLQKRMEKAIHACLSYYKIYNRDYFSRHPTLGTHSTYVPALFM